MRPEILDKLNKSIRNVNLENSSINDDEIGGILQWIKQNRNKATYVFLNNNNLTDKSAGLLVSELSTLELKRLDLQFNQFGLEGMKTLMAISVDQPHCNLPLAGNKAVDVGELEKHKQSLLESLKNKKVTRP